MLYEKINLNKNSDKIDYHFTKLNNSKNYLKVLLNVDYEIEKELFLTIDKVEKFLEEILDQNRLPIKAKETFNSYLNSITQSGLSLINITISGLDKSDSNIYKVFNYLKRNKK